MDPALVPLAVAIVRVGGAALGARINSQATRSAAEENRKLQVALAQENRETQRVLALDSARRKRREQWVDGTLQMLTQRYLRTAALYQELDQGRFAAVLQGVSSLRTELGHPLSHVGWFLYPEVRRSKEWLEYAEAEREFLTAAKVAALNVMNAADSARVWDFTHVTAGHERLRDAIGALHQAAERFIDAED